MKRSVLSPATLALALVLTTSCGDQAVSSPTITDSSVEARSLAIGGPAFASTGTNGSAPIAPPWIADDFSGYANITAFLGDPKALYSRGEDLNQNRMSLDTSTLTVAGHRLGHSLRYDFPDRSTDIVSSLLGRCTSYTITRNVALPVSVPEVFFEVYVKFSTNFTTVAPTSWGCASNADYKTLFIRTMPDNRFELKTGTSAQGITKTPYFRWWPRYANGPDTVQFARNAYDGNWHHIQIHAKYSHTTTSNDGLYKVWIDGAVAYDAKGFNTTNNAGTGALTGIFGAALGGNMNQGPGVVQTVWWGYWAAYRFNPGW